jgi:hypothetical protein
MNRQRNVNSILPTELPHTFSYIVVIFIHNNFESFNINIYLEERQAGNPLVLIPLFHARLAKSLVVFVADGVQILRKEIQVGIQNVNF